MVDPGRKAYCFFKIFITFLLIGVYSKGGYAQMVPSIPDLLNKLQQMQVSADSFYFSGTFSTYRRYGASERLKPDNAIFFTGLIAFTLKELKPYLNDEEKIICDSIIARAARAYPYFRNTDGRPTFNFWRANPPLVFPNSWFLNHFNKTQQLPDDLDDTVILWLSMNTPDSLAYMVKALMALHANGENNYVKSSYKKYRNVPAYSTWFGKKMPIDFDFCVLCNVLYFAHAFQLPLNEHDSASVDLLRSMIVHKEYLKNPAFISPHYGRTPLLLYHIARLLSRFSIPALDSLKPQLLADAMQTFHHSGNWLDSVLLSTAVFRLGGGKLAITPPDSGYFYANNATFFVASFSAILPRFWKKMLLNNQLIKYYYFCPAYRYTLYLENRVLLNLEDRQVFLSKGADNKNFVFTFDP